MVEYERASQAMEALAAAEVLESATNEATTRLQVIDKLLQDCLGWTPDQITCEEHQAGDYLDYVLGKPNRLAVLEAKRANRHFELPEGVINEPIVALKTLYTYSESNRTAIDQVLAYAQQGGIPVAILCNGSQLLAFLGSRQDGIPPSAGKVIMFSSLSDMLQRFSELWDYLSINGIRSGRLRQRLKERRTSAPPPERLSARLTNYPGFRHKSELETDVHLLADLFLQDLVQDEHVTDEFLNDCYCTSGALSQYALVSKEILRTRYLPLEDQVSAVEPVNPRGQKLSKLPADLISAALVRRPVILLGDVGVGKTIFLKHFFRIDAVDMLSNTVVFYVDFLKQSSLLEDVRSFLVSNISESLLQRSTIDIGENSFIRAVYNKEINQFKRGLFGPLKDTDPNQYFRQELDMLSSHVSDQVEHVRRSLSHLKATRDLQFVLVLDNVDHHEAAFQEKIFVVGQSLADTWPTAVFMSLRPDTFYNSRRAGSVSAYQPRVFTVNPPRTDLVILKRLSFAKKQLERFGRLDSFPNGLTIDSDKLLTYLEMLIRSFTDNDELKMLVDNLSSGNTRQALDYISNFVGSGYVSTKRILDAHNRGGVYRLPIHEFIRAMIYQDYSHYDPKVSTIANIFDISANDGREHFALPILLAACEAQGDSKPGGFVEEVHLYTHLQGLGYSTEQVEFHVERALGRKLLQTSADHERMRSLRITTAGGYMYKRMISMFVYIDGMISDTPIVDASVRRNIDDTRSITDALDRAGTFIRYLNDQWDLPDGTTTFSWATVHSQMERDLERVRQHALAH